MKLVYPEMAISQNAKSKKKINRSPSRQKNNKNNNSGPYEKQLKTQREYNSNILYGQDISEERSNINDARNYLLS